MGFYLATQLKARGLKASVLWKAVREQALPIFTGVRASADKSSGQRSFEKPGQRKEPGAARAVRVWPILPILRALLLRFVKAKLAALQGSGRMARLFRLVTFRIVFIKELKIRGLIP